MKFGEWFSELRAHMNIVGRRCLSGFQSLCPTLPAEEAVFATAGQIAIKSALHLWFGDYLIFIF